MSAAVTARLRRLVIERAGGICEYCLIHQDDAYFTFQVDHIISRKQRGPTSAPNLALACLRCNVAKGTDAGALIGRPRRLIRLYHPRRDRWSDHFRLSGARIVPLSDVGEATAQLLELNSNDRLILRRALIKAVRYPSIAALAYLR
ncbi:MAG: HNH endonuclease signature motif containing protein [Prosthecobacter sp.]|nr:HNH endonuclease signature motif containing protein [Prosthecobacter sp.]